MVPVLVLGAGQVEVAGQVAPLEQVAPAGQVALAMQVAPGPLVCQASRQRSPTPGLVVGVVGVVVMEPLEHALVVQVQQERQESSSLNTADHKRPSFETGRDYIKGFIV